jgi:hypothetical protein
MVGEGMWKTEAVNDINRKRTKLSAECYVIAGSNKRCSLNPYILLPPKESLSPPLGKGFE